MRGYAEPYGIKVQFDRRLLTCTVHKILSRRDHETDMIHQYQWLAEHR